MNKKRIKVGTYVKIVGFYERIRRRDEYGEEYHIEKHPDGIGLTGIVTKRRGNILADVEPLPGTNFPTNKRTFELKQLKRIKKPNNHVNNDNNTQETEARLLPSTDRPSGTYRYWEDWNSELYYSIAWEDEGHSPEPNTYR